MMRELLGAALALSLLGAASANAETQCHQGNQVVNVGRTMCQGGFTTTCMSNGAWWVDRHAPCFHGGAVSASCKISPVESAAPGVQACVRGRMRQCSEKGEWIDLIAECQSSSAPLAGGAR
ncbi:MAG: hypothetical protein JO021_23500 [Alphaproteobacteria bacterium]|nr:hypothetical protein [Alphaproteobacteria bacterium]